MIKSTFIKDIVKTDNISVEKNISISDAIDKMYKNKEGTIVVLDKNTVVGILTEKDLVQLLNTKTCLDQEVINVAKKNIISINENRRLEYALNILIDNHIRRLVIIDNNNKFVGLVTQEMIISGFETEYYRENLKVWQIVSSLPKHIITLEVDSVLEDAVASMFDNNIGSILISRYGKIIGIITERDLVYLASKKVDPSTPVEEIMTSPVISVQLNDSIQTIVDMMTINNIRRVLVKDLSGKDLCIMGTRDIVKNLKGTFGLFIETKLKYTKEALNNIHEIILELYKGHDSDLLIQWGNKKALSRYGSDIIDKPITLLVKEKDLNLLLHKLDKFDELKDYKLNIGDYSYKVSINKSYGADSILLVCKDMTKIIKLENEVKEQQLTFENIFQKSSDGILIIEEHKVIDCNESILKILEYNNKSKLIGLHPAQLCLKDNLDATFTADKVDELITLILKNGYHTFECVKLNKNGQNLWLEVVATKIVQNGKDIIHSVFRDISQRKRTEYELEQLNKDLTQRVNYEVEKNRKHDQRMLEQSRLAQMGEMMSMIAHQWRQPLAAISTASASINLKAKINKLDNNIAIEISKKILEYSSHLSSTIDDFRDFFKSNKRKTDITYEELINSILNIIEISISSKRISLVKNLNSTSTFNTYSNELKQVILNLIKNAEDVLIEKKIKDPKIIIETDGNKLTISDNGGGIPKNIIDKIFNPYFSTKNKKDGTGLGLYMSKIIIEDHCNRELTVLNNNDGAVFQILLGNEND